MTPARESTSRALPVWLWLGLPPIAVLAQIGAKAIGEGFYRRWFRGELGIVENLTVLLLVLAVVAATGMWRRRALVASKTFGPFALVMALGCIFFAGEEASWGQHWLGFEPPKSIAERNDQGEFNMHNDPVLEKVLDQLPRNLLTLAALVGGVIAPIVRRRRPLVPRFDGTASGWIWPARTCFPAALFAVTVSLPEKLFEASRGSVPYLFEISAGETKELCLALFLMVYLTTLGRELKEHERASA